MAPRVPPPEMTRSAQTLQLLGPGVDMGGLRVVAVSLLRSSRRVTRRGPWEHLCLEPCRLTGAPLVSSSSEDVTPGHYGPPGVCLRPGMAGGDTLRAKSPRGVSGKLVLTQRTYWRLSRVFDHPVVHADTPPFKFAVLCPERRKCYCRSVVAARLGDQGCLSEWP